MHTPFPKGENTEKYTTPTHGNIITKITQLKVFFKKKGLHVLRSDWQFFFYKKKLITGRMTSLHSANCCYKRCYKRCK